MNINSKIESSKKIKELDLNKFPEQIFKIGEEEKINLIKHKLIRRYS